MPYCVRCGVELQKSCKACPLCQTKVMLPDEEDEGEGVKAYSDHMPRRIRPKLNLAPSRSFLLLASFVIAVPILVTFFIDFTGNHTLTWSFYPMTSLALLWVLIAYPALLRGHTLLQVITVDLFAIALFLLSLDLYSGYFPSWSQYPSLSLLLVWVYVAAPLIFTWNYPILIIGMWFLGTAGFLMAMDYVTAGLAWFIPLGLPIAAMVTLTGTLGLALLKLVRAKPLLIIGLFMFIAAAFFTGIDAVVNYFVYPLFNLTWSPVLSSALIPTAVFLLIVNGNADLKAYLAKKFHV